MLPDVYFVGKIVTLKEAEGYGFVSLETGADVFFHLADDREIHVGPTSPFFSSQSAHPSIKIGTWLVFCIISTPKGLRASPWGLYAVWQTAQEEVDDFQQRAGGALQRY